jgi:N-acetylmuramoyl-L-alanine amidase
MTDAAQRASTTFSRRRTVGGSGVGLALAVATVAAGAPSAAAQEYTVRSGDTVSHIANRNATTVRQIVAANNLDARATIRVGQTLTIPGPQRPAASSTPPGAVAATTAGPSTHRVVAGDTVSALAARFRTTTAAIVAANGLDARAMIRVGQTLTIPTTGGTAATATPAQAPTPSSATHRVVAGDTVSALAIRYRTTTAAIVAANGLDARATIRVGQTLTIPGAGSPTAPTPVPAPAPAPAAPSTTTHRVVAGDTVSAIAARYGTTTAAVVAANNLDARATIRIGQTLTVPSSRPASAAPAAPPQAPLVGNTFLGRTYPEATVASANQNKATLLAIGVPSRAEMQAMVARTAREMGVDPALAQAVAFQESGFNHASVSPANAIGTMQVIPSSGEWASQLVGRKLNLLDPQDNVTAGVAILRQLIRSAPDLPTAIAGYYQGLAGVQRHGMYADTRRYVANVQTLMARFA